MYIIWILAKKELNIFFDSLIAYIVLTLFLGFSGFFTWLYGTDIFLLGQVDLGIFFNIAFWSLFFFIPALTMRMLAEEKRSGTIELLLTKPVTDREVILGKYLATMILVAIALLFTLPYIVTLANIGNLDIGGILGGYLALLLMSSAYIGIGLFASCITSNQIVGFLLALFIGIFFHLLFGVLMSSFSGYWSEFFALFSTSYHYESMSRGVIDSRDILFFLSITVLGVFSAEQLLRARDF